MRYISEEDRIAKALHDNLDERLRLEREYTLAVAGEVMAYRQNVAAKMLGVSITTMCRMIADGRVKVNEDGLVIRQSMMDYLGTTPKARRKASGGN